MGGFKAWAIRFVVEHLYDEVAKPLILLSFRKVGYVYHVEKGKHILRKIENAQDRDDWRTSVGDA